MKKLLLGFLFVFSFLFAVVIGTVATIWWKPEILLNEKRIRQGLGYALPEAKLSWGRFSLSFRPLGWTGKAVRLEAGNLCFAGAGVDACADRILLDLDFSLAELEPRITRVGALSLSLRHLTLAPGEPETEAPPSSLPDLRPPLLRDILPADVDLSLLGELKLELRRVRLESRAGPPMEIEANVSRLPMAAEGIPIELKARLREGKETDVSLSAQGILAQSAELRLKGESRGRAGEWRWRAPVSLVWSDRLLLTAEAGLEKPYDLDGKLKLDWRADRLALDLGGFASSKVWRQGRLGLKECALRSRLTQLGLPQKNELACSFFARPRNRLIPRLDGTFRLEADLRNENGDLGFRYKLTEESADAFLVSRVESGGEGVYETESGAFSEGTKATLEASLRIPEFRAWKQAWDGSPWAVPAPLHTLRGPVELKVTTDSFSKEKALANVTLKTELKDAKQLFFLTATAALRALEPLSPKRRLEIDGKIVLNDVQLEAPPLGLEEPPQFLPDKRFVTHAEEKEETAEAKAPSSVNWKIRIETEKPARIHTNLLPNPLPLKVNLALSDRESMEGYIEVQPMPINLFRKKAEIQRVRVSWRPGSSVGELDGLLLHRTPEVSVSVLLLGSTDEPRVEFQSEPPLSRQQIISVLLFNKSLAELSEEEASSTQNVSQALSDGALGLFSLFFLSSTPIQSVGYDPVTQTYSARVSIGSKTTLSVGSNFAGQSSDTVETREFGLRRRLGGPWAIRTELRQQADRPDVVMTLLEWFKRF